MCSISPARKQETFPLAGSLPADWYACLSQKVCQLDKLCPPMPMHPPATLTLGDNLEVINVNGVLSTGACLRSGLCRSPVATVTIVTTKHCRSTASGPSFLLTMRPISWCFHVAPMCKDEAFDYVMI
jgi:hypothetical protein